MKLTAYGYARLLVVILIVLPLSLRYSFNSHHAVVPAGYFILLRWIICPLLALMAHLAFNSGSNAWVWIYGIDAALFNPILIVRLGSVWQFVDCLTVILILASFALEHGGKPDDM
jgi:hypothetical protein